ncbi:hypothetical protein GCM10010383_41230 [Streptomyces lomondensis]|uniref:Amidase domain-containing protein n=1 Tax=Streptomyces lomondensis TaxID=68229 RepID=A0ABQ2X9Z4_9ACTN|nr:hypothetical protein GCM10010383_41230 [Streptomyces lomondensis]
MVTTRGSRLFAHHVPARDATAVARLRAAGAIPLAKTSLPEFSYWTETDNLLVGPTRNPWDPRRTPGGSSGGEAAAIAAGMSPLGLGSDVAPSVRGPAHFTGIAALKARPCRSRSARPPTACRSASNSSPPGTPRTCCSRWHRSWSPRARSANAAHPAREQAKGAPAPGGPPPRRR